MHCIVPTIILESWTAPVLYLPLKSMDPPDVLFANMLYIGLQIQCTDVHCTMQCIVQYSVVQCCTVHCLCIFVRCTVSSLVNGLNLMTLMHFTAVKCTVLHCTGVCFTALHCTALHYINATWKQNEETQHVKYLKSRPLFPPSLSAYLVTFYSKFPVLVYFPL